MMDELAFKAGINPLQFRLNNLPPCSKRLADTLRRIAGQSLTPTQGFTKASLIGLVVIYLKQTNRGCCRWPWPLLIPCVRPIFRQKPNAIFWKPSRKNSAPRRYWQLVKAGLSFSGLVRLVRIHEAYRLLKHHPTPLTVVDFCSGFSDSAHFSCALGKCNITLHAGPLRLFQPCSSGKLWSTGTFCPDNFTVFGKNVRFAILGLLPDIHCAQLLAIQILGLS